VTTAFRQLLAAADARATELGVAAVDVPDFALTVVGIAPDIAKAVSVIVAERADRAGSSPIMTFGVWAL
jgi:hypothetical protein